MRKLCAKLIWFCTNIAHSRAEEMSGLLFLPPTTPYFLLFPSRSERCLAHLSAKVVFSVCMLYRLYLSGRKTRF